MGYCVIGPRHTSDFITEVRQQLVLKLEHLARGVGVSFVSINRWGNGKTRPMKPQKAQFERFSLKLRRKVLLSLP